ncbi:MAG TPA: hypothetical protein VHM29_02485 [Acidimicrobiia bacterium]|nr:hypothetical protein [Acidimicrobiia bacterium]
MAEHESTPTDPMGPAIIRGILIGIPVVLVGLTVGIWLITPLDIFESALTAALPAILLGAFGGGFAGMAMTMRE